MLKIRSAEKHANSKEWAEHKACEGLSEPRGPLVSFSLKRCSQPGRLLPHGVHSQRGNARGCTGASAEEGSMPRGKPSSQGYERIVSKLSHLNKES